ncbi:hypothetical protein D3C78_1711490 [compost metagenome]
MTKKNHRLRELIELFEEDESAKYSAAIRDLGFLDSTKTSLQSHKKELTDLISSEEIKHIIATNYLNKIQPDEKETEWSRQIEDFLFS